VELQPDWISLLDDIERPIHPIAVREAVSREPCQPSKDRMNRLNTGCIETWTKGTNERSSRIGCQTERHIRCSNASTT